MVTKKWEKTIEFSPAYDKRHPNPKKNYGIHNVDIRFVLKKGNKAVQFLFGTDWFLPETVKKYREEGIHGTIVGLRGKNDCGVKGWDVGYHSPKPMFEGHTSIGECVYTGGECYYDGSGLYAQENQEILIREGSPGVWKFLKKEWKQRFEKSVEPSNDGVEK